MESGVIVAGFDTAPSAERLVGFLVKPFTEKSTQAELGSVAERSMLVLTLWSWLK
jgi:hypothetical protein